MWRPTGGDGIPLQRLFFVSGDPAAANNRIAVVKHRGLPGRNGKLRFVQQDLGLRPPGRVNGCRNGPLAVPDLYCRLQLMLGRAAHPVQALYSKQAAGCLIACSDDQRVFTGLHTDHVQRLWSSYAQAAALPHRVKGQALMLAQHPS